MVRFLIAALVAVVLMVPGEVSAGKGGGKAALTVSPSVVAVCEVFTVTGTGFPDNATVAMLFTGQVPNYVVADGDGNLSFQRGFCATGGYVIHAYVGSKLLAESLVTVQ